MHRLHKKVSLMTPNEFIAKISPIAVQLRLEGSPIFPSVRIAQSALETGWKIPSWNNLVGFKVGSRPPNGYWRGAYVNKGTWEVYDGKRTDVVAAFRAYDTIDDCFRDQDELFKLARYDRVRAAQTPEQQADMLYECGYATDPQYASKIKNIMSSYGLKKFDAEVDRVLQALQKQIDQLTKRIEALERKPEQRVADWAKEAQAWVVEKGISDGERPRDPVTRQEVWAMLLRYDRLSR